MMQAGAINRNGTPFYQNNGENSVTHLSSLPSARVVGEVSIPFHVNLLMGSSHIAQRSYKP